MANEIKFMYNGIKINGKLIKGCFSKGGYTNGALFCFYADSYYCPELRAAFAVKNDSDIMTDYFEEEKIYFFENDEHIEEVQKAWQKKEMKVIERAIKKYEKRLEKTPDNKYCLQELEYYNKKLQNLKEVA